MKQLSRSAKMAIAAAAIGVTGIAGMGAAAFAGETPSPRGQMAGKMEMADEQADDAREAQMLAQARVSAGDAARAAEQHTGLKAGEVEIDDEAATPMWEVSVGSGANERNVMVDAMSGQVKSVAVDNSEAGEGGEGAD